MIGADPPKWEQRLCFPGDKFDRATMAEDAADWGTCALAECVGVRRRMDVDEFDMVDSFIADRYGILWSLGHAFNELVSAQDYARAERIRIRIARAAKRDFFSGHILLGPAQPSPWERLPEDFC